MPRKTSRPSLPTEARHLLATAARRKTHAALPWPRDLKLDAPAQTKLIETLLAQGYLQELPASKPSLSWRVDRSGQALTIIATPAGLAQLTVPAAAPGVSDPSTPAERSTKSSTVLALLRDTSGATIADLMAATGWQAHSIRGFISGTVSKRLGHSVRSVKTAGNERRYHVEA